MGSLGESGCCLSGSPSWLFLERRGKQGSHASRDLWHAILLLYVSIKIGIECSAKLGRCSAPCSKSHNNGSRYGQAAPCAMHPSEVDLLNPEPPGQTLQTLTWDHYIPEATPPPNPQDPRYPEPTPQGLAISEVTSTRGSRL